MLSIVDSRIQYYVRQRHHKVFNSSNNSPTHISRTNSISTTTSPNQSPSHHEQQHNKRLVNPTNTLYNRLEFLPKIILLILFILCNHINYYIIIRYKELAAGGNLTSPLITLADNLRMPAMLVAKNVLEEHINEDKSIDQSEVYFLNCHSQNDNSITSTSTQDNSVINFLDTTANVDVQLSQSLNWLNNKLLSMQEILPSADVVNQSNNSSINSNSYCKSKTTKNLSPHQLATSTWLIRTDPQLAYQVYKCSVIDSYYGSCVEFIKRY